MRETFREKISFETVTGLQQTGRVCADLMSGGRLFQSRLQAAVKARSSTLSGLRVMLLRTWRSADIHYHYLCKIHFLFMIL